MLTNNRYLQWLHTYERRVFRWFNQTISHSALDRFFGTITHMGGAVFAIACTLSLALFAPGKWGLAGLQSAIALTASFMITTIVKKKFRRRRPYMVLPYAKVGRNPLKDPSFPSGHTTAIFSIMTPFLFISGWFALCLLLLAILVGLSRIYLGLHYPSDCIAGCIVGTVTALFVVLLVG
ncbi:hypothetical protein PAE9249_04171 [Paenibacillus sp. CECT 9249]|uniref:phosphatase PAP2 family protein n=1 Tax=Paenibacillus sp. CECT 9249 TaxID=2845385 RepID=UPI001E348B2C|nr:phosphatase PAP2 family protein [Paenibacillus sp. CECT 9249]CAH0121639.1 hypothetical protein PAE9249_04171 [Paenibacillus sp. CECT 9249]